MFAKETMLFRQNSTLTQCTGRTEEKSIIKSLSKNISNDSTNRGNITNYVIREVHNISAITIMIS